MGASLAILNIGPFELLVLGGAAVLLFGGDLPQTARKVARFVARMRSTVHELSSEFQAADRKLERENPLRDAREKAKSVAADVFAAIPDVDRSIEGGPTVPGMDPDGGTDNPAEEPVEPAGTDASTVDDTPDVVATPPSSDAGDHASEADGELPAAGPSQPVKPQGDTG